MVARLTYQARKWQYTFVILLSLIIFFLFSAPLQVQAKQLDILKMDIQVQLMENGDARIHERWDVESEGYGEIYKEIKRADKQEITDFTVELNGKKYDNIGDDWDIDDSFDNKAYKNGFHEDEINWGVSKEGRQTYDISYTIQNFVMQTETDQMINWQFISRDLDTAPRNFSLNIESPHAPFSLETEHRVWAFGYHGQVEMRDGKIVANNDQALQDGDGCILLIRIPNGTYATEQKVKQDFDSYLKEAFKGSDYDYQDYQNNQSYEDIKSISKKDKIIRFVSRLMIVLTLGFIGIILVYALVSRYLNRRAVKKYYPSMKQASKELDGFYYRDLPSETIYQSYLMLDNLQVKNLDENYTLASILNLVKLNSIRLVETGNKYPSFQLSEDHAPRDGGSLEAFWLLLLDIADGREFISQKEIENYFEYNTSLYEKFITECERDSRIYLREQDLSSSIRNDLYTNQKDRRRADLAFGYHLTEKGMEHRKNWVGFYNYLRDFSLLSERQAYEVLLWDQLMIYATVLGISKELEKEFISMNPNYHEESIFTEDGFSYSDYYFYSNLMSDSYVQTVERTTLSSAGGGGDSSFGGGGGSFGGGGGGGR